MSKGGSNMNDVTNGDMASFWNQYEQAAGSFLSKVPDKLSYAMACYTRTLCEDFRGADILDVGCGDGFDAIGITRQFTPSSVLAIELSSSRVKAARENVQRAGVEDRVRVEEMDANDLKCPDNSFDAIYCYSVLLFLDRPRAFKEIVRVLKPSGFLICAKESLAGNPLLQLYRKSFPKIFPKTWKGKVEKLANRMTLSEVEAIGEQFFYKTTHKEFHLFFSVLIKIPYLIYYRLIRNNSDYQVTTGQLAARIDDTVMQIFPLLRRWAWVSVIRYDFPRK
jgi:ubiquinone/menaquinone biosynthesis C-methylase UbiE